MKLSRTAALMAGVALALPVAAVSTTANAGTAPPPCTKHAIKKAVQKSQPDVTIKIDTKYCKDYWASGAYTIDDMDEAAYLLTDKGGKWKAVSSRKYAKLCEPDNTTLPKKIKKHACVS